MSAAGVLAGRPTARAMYAEYDVQTIGQRDLAGLGGKFRVAFRGHATPALAWDVSAHKLQEALEQLPLGAGSGVTPRLAGAGEH